MNDFSILILDPLSERGRNAGFLLQLAKYRVSVVENDDEAFNWIVSRRDSADSPALLLVNDCYAEMPIFTLLAELRRQGVSLPVLFVERGADSACLTALGALEAVYFCRPDTMLTRIRALTQ